MSSRYGFTGTRAGMTKRQGETFVRIAPQLDVAEWHHGDCIGSDKQSHDVGLKLHWAIIIHPPESNDHRAFCMKYREIRYPKSYLARNNDIVMETDRLVATPAEFQEKLRSGTWATIRYARALSRPLLIIWPDGSYMTEGLNVWKDITL